MVSIEYSKESQLEVDNIQCDTEGGLNLNFTATSIVIEYTRHQFTAPSRGAFDEKLY